MTDQPLAPATRIQASPAARLRQRTRALQAAGHDIIVLSSGELFWPTPAHVIAAAHAAALRGETQYTNADGTPELKEAIRAKLARDNGLNYAGDEVIVCTGSMQAIFAAFMATLAPGDEVIVPAPYWASYLDQVRLVGGVPVTVACGPNQNFKLGPDRLAAAITERTRWLVLNNPTNPTGALYSGDELKALAQVLLRHPRVRILADELYEHFVFDGRQFASFAAVEPRLKHRVLTVNGVSKTYAMTGWRVGYAAGARELVEAMTTIQSHTTACASSIGQAAAVAALTGPQEIVRERAAALATWRDLMADMLDAIPGLSCGRRRHLLSVPVLRGPHRNVHSAGAADQFGVRPRRLFARECRRSCPAWRGLRMARAFPCKFRRRVGTAARGRRALGARLRGLARFRGPDARRGCGKVLLSGRRSVLTLLHRSLNCSMSNAVWT